jgi:hypothetical protein
MTMHYAEASAVPVEVPTVSPIEAQRAVGLVALTPDTLWLRGVGTLHNTAYVSYAYLYVYLHTYL